MYTYQELKRANELLTEMVDVIGGTDSSAHGQFVLVAKDKKLQIFPTSQKPVGATRIVRLTKTEMITGIQAAKWDRIHRILRDFVAEKILE